VTVAYARGFKNDVYISYSHVDDERIGDEMGWVSRFRADLDRALRQQLGADTALFFDRRDVLPGDAWDDAVVKNLRESAIFVAVLSPSYIARELTMRELALFREAAEFEVATDSAIDLSHRLVLLELRPVPGPDYPASLREYQRTRFYRTDRDTEVALPLSPLSDRDAYYRQVEELAARIVTMLRELNSASQAAPPRPATERSQPNADGPKIVLSYRRSDTATVSRRIFDRLASHFGEQHLLMDLGAASPGLDYRQTFEQLLTGAGVLLAVIGPNWLGSGGRARINDEADPVRIEIESAMRLGVKIVPVLVDGAPMPPPQDVPESLRSFLFLNAATIDSGASFLEQMDRLIRSLERMTGLGQHIPDRAETTADGRPRIFLAYRREDSAALTGRLFDRLQARYGKGSVSMDVDIIPFGADFRSFIVELLDTINVMLVVVGPRWLGTDASGRRRIDNPNDMLRIETEFALQRGIPTVPVLVAGAAMPRPDELPAGLRPFTERQAAVVDTGRDFHADVDRLMRNIDDLLERPPQATEQPAAETQASETRPQPQASTPWLRSAAEQVRSATRRAGAALYANLSARAPPLAATAGVLAAALILATPLLVAAATRAVVHRGDFPFADAALGARHMLGILPDPMGPPPRAHADAITALAFTRDGTHVITTSYDKTVKAWNLATGARDAVRDVDVLDGQSGYVPLAASAASMSEMRIATRKGMLVVGADGQARGVGENPIFVGQGTAQPALALIAGANDAPTAVARNWFPARGDSKPLTILTWPGKEPLYVAGTTGGFIAIESPAARPNPAVQQSGSLPGAENVRSRPPAGAPSHRGLVTALARSGDGHLASVADDGSVILWTIENGAFKDGQQLDRQSPLLMVLRGHTNGVVKAAFSLTNAAFIPDPKGRLIATASLDNTAKLWDGATGQLLRTLVGHEGPLTSVAFSPDSQRIVTTSTDKTARLWNVADGQLIATFRGHEAEVTDAAFDPAGSYVASSSRDKTARIWDLTGQQVMTLEGHAEVVHSVGWSPDGKSVVTASDDKTARVLNLETNKIVVLRGHDDSVTSAAFSLNPDHNWIVTSSRDKTARIWDAATGQPIGKPLVGHGDIVFTAEFSWDGSRIVTGSKDQTARLWDAATGEPIGAPFAGHTDSVWSAAFSLDASRIVTASQDQTARVWSATAAIDAACRSCTTVAFSANGKRLIAAGSAGVATIWDVASGRALASFDHGAAVNVARLTADGAVAITAGDDGAARLWDVGQGALLAVIRGHGEAITQAELTPNGTALITAARDGSVRMTSIAQARMLHAVDWVPALGWLAERVGEFEQYLARASEEQVDVDWTLAAAVSAPPPAAGLLGRFGITVADLSPAQSALVLLSSRALGQAQPGSPRVVGAAFLTQTDTGNEPASFTLRFDVPLDAFTFTQPALAAATSGDTTYPAWTAVALDAAGNQLAAVGAQLTRSTTDVAAQSHTLNAPSGRRIAAVRFTSDPRLDGKPFAAFGALLIERLTLIRPRGSSQVRAPVGTIGVRG
jgi:WD40 repeat protein